MNRAKKTAEQKGFTLEMLYRAADKKMKGKISIEDFKKFLKGLGFGLKDSQLLRFLYLVDEDCSGSVYRGDYYKTLAAYGVNSETNWRDKGVRTYKQM